MTNDDPHQLILILPTYLLAFFKKNYYLTVFLFILLFWFLIFITSGSLFSGYHFTDDHEIVEIHYKFTVQNLNLWEVISQWLHKDLLTGRLRSFYYLHRIIETRFLGINFTLWSVYTGLLGVFSTFFLFVFAKLLHFSIKEALLFSFFITLGSQSAIWWQLGPAETIGTFLLSTALVLTVIKEIFSRFQILYEISIILLILMMSLSKESFILFIPAIALIKIWVASKFKRLSWIQSIKSNYLSLSALGLIFLAEILAIKFSLGLTPDIGYAGIDKLSIAQITSAAKSLNQAGAWWIALISLIVITLMSTVFYSYSQIRFNILKKLYFPIILFILVTFPQILLYAKSGISQRYLLPVIFGYAFLIISLYKIVEENFKLVAKLILFLLVMNLGLKLSLAWNTAHIFALEGKSTNALLQTIEKQTTAKAPIIVVTHPVVYYEWNFSIKKYLNYVSQRNNLYLATYGQRKNSYLSVLGRTSNDTLQEIESFYEYNTFDKIKNKMDIKCIITLPEMNKIFLKNSSNWFVSNNFQQYKFENFNRNLNKNSQIYFYCKKPVISNSVE